MKQGRVSQEVKDKGIERQYYASQVFKFGSDEDGNRDVITLLATFILLSLSSLREALLRPKLPDDKEQNFPVRRVVSGCPTSYTAITIPGGINWDEQPKEEDISFYALRQLGYGENGTCCLGVNEDGAPCAIKFFHATEEVQTLASKEALAWKSIYGTTFPFVKHFTLSNRREVLIMPYLDIPCSDEERLNLTVGTPSPLFEALKTFSDAGYKHNDLKWDHVGCFYEYDTDASCFKKSVQKKQDTIVIFCDLGSVEEFGEEEDRIGWVNSCFDELKQHINMKNDE